MKEYWMCIIGGTNLSNKYKGKGADWPLRQAVRNKYNEIFDTDDVCVSGWGIDEERYKILRNLHLKSTLDLKQMLFDYEHKI